MELQGLYELNERLGAAAVAGVNLIGEDFRLKRAVEQILPLAQAVPVIKKLYDMTKKAMDPDCEDRTGCLLDALALSDALLCTQAGYGTKEEIKPLELITREYGDCLPYSQAAPLEQALTGPGGGRLAPITRAMKETPWIFRDYRLQEAVITALSDRYGDIADAAEWFLAKMDGSIVPLLKRGFWETTEGGRIHRLRVIESICLGSENDFYVKLLDKAKKELRAEAIHALRFEDGNEDLLLELAQTEKGICLEMTQQVLGMVGSGRTDTYWEKQLKSRGAEVVGYLRFSESDTVSDYIAELISESLDQSTDERKKETDDRIKELLSSMPGKGSAAMQDIYRRAAAKDFPHPQLQEDFAAVLTDSIIYSQDERLISLAEELSGSRVKAWMGPALAADFLTKPAAAVYEAYYKRIPRDSFLGREGKEKARKAVLEVLSRISCSQKDGLCGLVCRIDEKAGAKKAHRIRRKLFENPDPGWMKLLMDEAIFGEETVWGLDEAGRSTEKNRDMVLFSLLPPLSRDGMASYFYKRALETQDNQNLCRILVKCGWKDFKGLILSYVKKNYNSSINLWALEEQMKFLPMTVAERQMEIQEIDRFLCGFPKNSPARKNWDTNEYRRNAINQAVGLFGTN